MKISDHEESLIVVVLEKVAAQAGGREEKKTNCQKFDSSSTKQNSPEFFPIFTKKIVFFIIFRGLITKLSY